MTDKRHTRKARNFPSVRLGGTSLLAMMASGFAAQPAWGQATPGSPQCPVVGNVVTCSGALPDGVAVASGTYQGLTVSNVTGDMSATNRPVIAFRSDAPTTTVTLDDPDSGVRLTTSGSPGDSLVGAIQAILPGNSSFSLTSNLDVFVNEASGTGQRMQPFGILVAGEGGTFAIDNSGDIEMRDIDFAPDGASILIDVFGADLVSLSNSGDLTQVNSDVSTGIYVAADNRRVEILNEGDILLPGNSGFSGIELAYQPTGFAPPAGGLRDVTPYTGVGGSLSYHPAPVMPLESYAIRNSGVISVEGFGIIVDTGIVDQTGTGIGDLGAPDGSIVNDGTVQATFGITASHSGDRNILNNSRLENFDDDEFFGIYVDQGHSQSFLPSTVRIENGSAGVIEYDGTFIAWGVHLTDTPATLVNAGRISMIGGDSNRGIEVRGFGKYLGLTTIENSGTIQVTGPTGWGILTNFSANPTGAFSDTRIANSSLIESTGAGGRALQFTHSDISGSPGGAQRGQVSLDLASTSIVRGGSGADGAAIVFNGGESHSILNRGLITASSGRAIVGGTAVETLDNSGRIEGSVLLAAGNDAVTMRGGAVQIGTLDGGADTDSLLFAIASGEASVTGAILNFESVRKTGAGTLTLRDTGTIAPGLSFEAGTLLAEGSLGATAIAAPTGTTFGGSGSVGAVTIADGATITPGGNGIGTLTVSSLSLSNASRLLFDLGAPGIVGGTANDLISVTGNLVLDGLLDVDARPDFGSGVYRLINYGGALTDNGLVMGNAPAQQYEVQTAVAGQVNLVVSAVGPGPTPPIQFWDGADTAPDGTIDGGSGTWSATATNWTRADGQVNEAWNGGNFAVFQGTAGTVTIDPAGMVADGLQFAVNGYQVQGGPLTLEAPATVRVGDGSAGGSAFTATIASAIGGTGGLTKTDFGTLILSGTNSYTGGTTVASGVLQVSADSALGAASGALTLNGGTLRTSAAFTSARTLIAGAGGGTIDTQANALTLSGPVQGSGALTKTGSGTLTLSGSSSAYTGHFTVGGGALRLDGSLGGTLEIGAGTTLSGTGTMGNLVVAGTLSPGNSIGTLTATGNAIFRSGSVFAVELTAAGTSDRLNVAGTATIEGGTVAITALDPELNYTDGSTYTFLNAAGGRTGTFAGLTESSAFLDFALGYTASTAFITVDVVKTFPEVAQTFNQEQAATGLRDLDPTAQSDSLAVYNAILLLDEAPARAAFDASSGEIYPVLMAASLRRAEMAGARLAARGWQSGGEGLVLWGGAEGHDGSMDQDGNGAAYSFDGSGLVLGADYRGAGFALGVGGGWSKGDVELPGRASSARTEGWHLGLHASAGTGNSGFSAAGSALRMQGDADVTRAIAFGTVARSATSNVDIETTALTADLRYGAALGGGWAAGPMLSASWSKVELDAFAEAGAGALALSGDGSSDDWSSYAAGAFLNLSGARGRIDVSVQYLNGDGRTIEAGLALAGASASPFSVRAAAGGEEAALVRVGGQYELGGGWSIGGNVRAVTGSGGRAVSGAGTVSLRF